MRSRHCIRYGSGAGRLSGLFTNFLDHGIQRGFEVVASSFFSSTFVAGDYFIQHRLSTLSYMISACASMSERSNSCRNTVIACRAPCERLSSSFVAHRSSWARSRASLVLSTSSCIVRKSASDRPIFLACSFARAFPKMVISFLSSKIYTYH